MFPMLDEAELLPLLLPLPPFPPFTVSKMSGEGDPLTRTSGDAHPIPLCAVAVVVVVVEKGVVVATVATGRAGESLSSSSSMLLPIMVREDFTIE